MSKNLKLKAIRLYELSTVIDAITPKELENLKDIRLAAGIVKDLQDGCKIYTEKIVDLNLKQQKDLKKYQENANKELSALETQKEKDDYIAKLNAEFQSEVSKKFKKEFEETQDEAEKECTVELSDEKFAKLVTFFEKFGVKSYIRKEALLETSDALGIE